MMVGNMALKIFILFLFLRFALLHGATKNGKQHYIVYMGHHSHPNSESVIAANHDVLTSVVGSLDGAKEAILHHYSKSFRGFSAMLTPQQAHKLSGKDSVVCVFESRMQELHTTRSWQFLGVDPINQDYGKSPMAMGHQSDVIVGVIDTGIWPESRSFSDESLGPMPTKFKGNCTTGESFTLSNCNRKIIGARFYSKGFEAEHGPLEKFAAGQGLPFFRSPRDTDGHGTHVASTIAGSFVPNATVPGITMGTARGGAPGARLAIYKACWFGLCSDADILAAIDDAIHDGVDIISMSFGPSPPQPSYFSDVNSIGSFHALQRGILVSASTGNSFFPGAAANIAPWILTVASSTIDREFPSYIHLGNSTVLKGFGLNPSDMKGYYGLIAGSDAAAPGVPTTNASFCKNNTLDSTLIKGKIVVYEVESIIDNGREKILLVEQGGGVGIIIIDPIAKDIVVQYRIANVVILPTEARKLRAFLATEKNPIATIKKTSESLFSKPAPMMATYSSKGPNIISPEIIKPDITSPGVNILAAWSPLATINSDGISLDYNIITGTSMACPHASAVAAIIKSIHPSWSPAEIKSSMMTTASILDNTERLIGRNPDGAQATPFDYGSGHINLVAALDPGLVYDYDSKDVIDFLCSTGATPPQLANLTGTGEATYCKYPSTPSYNFNYPSIGVLNINGSLSVRRTVTYYGKGSTVYYSRLEYPTGVKVSITPGELKFSKTGQKKAFTVGLTPYKSSNGSFVFGALTWSNGIQRIRSPIAVSVLSV